MLLEGRAGGTKRPSRQSVSHTGGDSSLLRRVVGHVRSCGPSVTTYRLCELSLRRRGEVSVCFHKGGSVGVGNNPTYVHLKWSFDTLFGREEEILSIEVRFLSCHFTQKLLGKEV